MLRTYLLTVFIFSVSSLGSLSQAAPGPRCPSAHVYCIRQDRSQHDGVLVSRPNPEDQFVSDFLRQNNIQDLQGYSRWLEKNLDYRWGKSDRWASPQEILNRKFGDCKDFASLNYAVLRVLGFEPRLLALSQTDQGHAICAFMVNGFYLWFDNQRLIRTKATSLPELARDLLQGTPGTKLAELDPETQKWRTIRSPS